MNRYKDIYSHTLQTVLLCTVLYFCSCVNPKIDHPKELMCITPPIECKPKVWTGKPFDTTEKVNNTFLRIRKIKGADSDSNEWKLLLNKNAEGFMTTDNVLKEIERKVQLSSSLLSIETNTPFQRTKTQKDLSQGMSASISSSPIHAYSTPSTNSVIYTASLKVAGRKLSAREWSSHPAFTPDKKYMFFSSDREGGFGGTDIWFARVSNDTVFNPINCGPNINTPCDEISPFISDDGEYLYFSSPGHETVGGYDILFSRINSTELSPNVFSNAANYGAPVNTVFDEVFPTSFENPKTLLFYSSNQPQKGTIPEKDFDMFVLREFYNASDIERVESKKNPFTVKIEGRVKDIRNNPVADADVIAKNSRTSETVAQTKSNESGEYSLEIPNDNPVDITAQKDNSLYFTEKLNFKPEDKYRPRTIEITLPEKIALRINFPNDISEEPYTFVLDSNGVETEQTWQKELDIVAENIKRYSSKVKRIELVGHTDDVASEAYNKALAQKRVNFIANELVKRGVSKKMLSTRSEGEQKPLPPRTPEDLEYYRKRLRRVELEKIIE